MITSKEVESLLIELRGSEVTNAWRGYGSAIFLELGHLMNRGVREPRGEQTIAIEWSWRLQDQHSVLLGSWDDNNLIDQFPNTVIGETIGSLGLFTELNELDIKFKSTRRLLSFTTTFGDPQWYIRFKNNNYLAVEKSRFTLEKKM